MIFYLVFALSLGCFGGTKAHYLFNRFIVNNTWTREFEYVRPVGPLTWDIGDWYTVLYPNTNTSSYKLRCGPVDSGNRSKTVDILAGDKVGFGVGAPGFRYGFGPNISRSQNYPYDVPRAYHPGPASVWLSKAPTDDLDSYTGDGDWFKIYQVVGRTEQSMPVSTDPTYAHQYEWGTYLATSWNFTIPTTTPPGKYLLRFEHVRVYKRGPNSSTSTEYYTNCAQVNIINNGKVGTPSPLAKIPGIYVGFPPEFEIDIWDHSYDVKKFKYPGPTVWQG
ncbi:hypothetical protein CC78DRAFT_564769 [Lojkania enalia]|uniref:lytic cellulose monooxygenase (C4-dehydrogenating) n=1 Tax=Lojkania enalia TaxID=147567 RepID=A0A9P4TQ86_9PLEO|nr:hypothetical protein CC78DRAFT_564769 [Didymosphaeria enalia]